MFFMRLTINRPSPKCAESSGETRTKFPLASAQRSWKATLSLPDPAGMVENRVCTEAVLADEELWSFLGSLRAC